MRVESVTVGPDAIGAVLHFAAAEPLRTCEVPGLADRLLDVLPGLKGHRCDNGSGMTFPEELRDTEIAHAVEHATLELMAMAGSPVTLRGETSWDFSRDGRGVFRLRLAYDDSAVALGALKSAVTLVDALVRGETAPDATAEASRLRRVGRPRRWRNEPGPADRPR